MISKPFVVKLFRSLWTLMGTFQENYSCMGIGSLRRACKLLVTRRPSNKRLPLHNRHQSEENLDSISKSIKDPEDENQNNKSMNCEYNSYNDEALLNHPNTDNLSRPPSPLSRSLSDPPSTSFSDELSTSSHPLGSQTPTPATGSAMGQLKITSRSVDASLGIGRWPIMFSNSNGLVKPPPMEKKLPCTLKELCFGCVKKIMIRRDVVTNNGKIIQEEELLTIKIKPGWTSGTKITFEGMGNETPGTHPADIVFVIEEKVHPFFRREGDDLALAIEVPLMHALTGCELSIPLLSGDFMSVTIDEIVYPGYEKIVQGQGMPVMNEQGKRGNLILGFLVEFPNEMTEEERSDVYSVLYDCFDYYDDIAAHDDTDDDDDDYEDANDDYGDIEISSSLEIVRYYPCRTTWLLK